MAVFEWRTSAGGGDGIGVVTSDADGVGVAATVAGPTLGAKLVVGAWLGTGVAEQAPTRTNTTVVVAARAR
jgi:hypothetical protein